MCIARRWSRFFCVRSCRTLFKDATSVDATSTIEGEALFLTLSLIVFRGFKNLSRARKWWPRQVSDDDNNEEDYDDDEDTSDENDDYDDDDYTDDDNTDDDDDDDFYNL